MRGLAGAPGLLEHKKTAPYPTWDKSCTPAIPPKLTFWKTSARFTRHHACPMDNGWVPVGIYLVSRSSRPRKPIRPAAPRPDLTTQDSLQVCSASYYSFSQVSCCSLVGAIITASLPFVNPIFLFAAEKNPRARKQRALGSSQGGIPIFVHHRVQLPLLPAHGALLRQIAGVI